MIGAPPTADIGRSIRPTAIVGFAIVALFFGGFGAWAALAPLDSAVIASGVIVVEGSRQTAQHLEGGIVEELLVRAGDSVRAGDVLIRLDQTQQRAELELLRGQSMAASVARARLIAERDGLDVINIPGPLIAGATDRDAVLDLLLGQRAIFESRRRFVASQRDIQKSQIAQLEAEITGLENEIAAQDRQLALIGEETTTVADLLEQGYERRPRLLALQRDTAEIEGQRANSASRIARTRQAIGETELDTIDLENRLRNEVVETLQETETELDELQERIRGAEDVLRRTVITAPVSGSIVGLSVFTAGGVIAPGAALMDIVPEGAGLIVETSVLPTDIEDVHVGQESQVRLTSFNQRDTPTFDGTVQTISADALTNERTGETYYIARIALDPKAEAFPGVVLQPGMPADVMIITGARTTIDYLLLPIKGSLRRGIAQN